MSSAGLRPRHGMGRSKPALMGAALVLALCLGPVAEVRSGEVQGTDRVEPQRSALPAAREVARQVDALLVEALAQHDARPAGPAGDGAFLRRAVLDLNGTVPTVEEARAVLVPGAPVDREALVRGLLDTPDAARHFASWYGRLLLGRANVDPRRRQALEEFLRTAWREGLPYDRLVAALVTARGTIDEHGESAFVGQFAQDTAALAGRTARLFLGVRIACAQCHDHPFSSWTQRDFAGLAAFFGRTRIEKIPTAVDVANGLNSRAEQQARQLETALTKARAELLTAEEALQKAEAARLEAERALAPSAERLKKLVEAAAGPGAHASQLEVLRAEVDKTAREAAERAAQPDLPEALRAAAREQVKLAGEVAAQMDVAQREARATLEVHQERVKRAEGELAPLKSALAKCTEALRAAEKRHQALKAYVDAAPLLLAQGERLRDQARRLAAVVPDLVRARHQAAALPVPADRYRVYDQPGKVSRRAPNPAKPHEGDGRPRDLDGTSVDEGVEYAHLRESLAAWMTAPTNPSFARAAVNRFAQQLWGRALVDPVDEVGDGTRAFSAAALALLADDFVASGYDLRRLVLVLTLSLPYQQAADGGTRGTGGAGGSDGRFVRAPVRELQPEVLFRALTRALLPGLAGDEQAGLGNSDEGLRGAAALFDDGEDRPALAPRSGMRAALWLQNGGPLAGVLSGRKDGLATRLVGAGLGGDEAVERVFQAFLTRLPSTAERTAVLAALPALPATGDAKARAAAESERVRVLEDLMWSLANSSEFLTNH